MMNIIVDTLFNIYLIKKPLKSNQNEVLFITIYKLVHIMGQKYMKSNSEYLLRCEKLTVIDNFLKYACVSTYEGG